ncbi:MAG: protein kinase [Candidatus Neomarinimicrobiota bacterium]
MIGQTISHYRIIEKLGEGGMGVVYKAEDTKLKRTVALKFLPHHLLANEEDKTRFLYEAQAASALSHPNIMTVFAIEDAEDPSTAGRQTFIAMEYVEGETLKDKLEKGPLRTKELLNIVIPVAEGLNAAHSNEIIHRDIKSENIMISKDGLVKIMDFGLAKRKGVTRVTEEGSTLGTLAYMSPEQAEGLKVDRRSDLFSFGVVMYEMATGQLPFKGEHDAAVLYAIVNDLPLPVTTLNPNIPQELDRFIHKALEKEPEDRYQHADDLGADLKKLKRDLESGKTKPGARERKLTWRNRPQSYVGAALLMILIIVVGLFLTTESRKESVRAEAKLTKVTFGPGLEDEPTWSPDGKFVAYTTDERGNLDIVVLPLGGGKPIWVIDSNADDAQPSWSPDGGKLAFVSSRDHGGRLSIVLGQGSLTPYINGKGGDIFLVPALGGTPVKLVDNGYYPAWSPDGQDITFQSNRGGQWDLWLTPSEGGEPTQLTDDEDFDYQPSWSPDGKWIVYGSGAFPSYDLHVIPSAGGQRIKITDENSLVVRPAWTPDGKHILFSSARTGIMNIWKVLFSPSAHETSVSPMRVTIGEGDDINVSAAADGSRITFATLRNTADIWELTLSSGELRQVTFETSSEGYPHLSPDGQTLLVQSDRSGKVELWTMDLNGRVLSKLTSAESAVFSAQWSPDGKQIVYQKDQKIVTQKLGDVTVREIAPEGNIPAWSPNGEKLAFSLVKDGNQDVWIYSLEHQESKQITFLESRDWFPTWSPDGRYITFQAEMKGTRDIWIVPSEGGTPNQITSGESEDSHPRWSPANGDQILFVRDHKNLCLVSVSTGKVKQITNFVEANLILDYPSWSFDGKTIYFSLTRKVGDVYVLENY